MRKTLTPIALRCYSDPNDGAHGDPRPTGCEYGFRKRLRCEKCPHWSEARFGASLGELYAEGFREGMKNIPNKSRAHWDQIRPLHRRGFRAWFRLLPIAIDEMSKHPLSSDLLAQIERNTAKKKPLVWAGLDLSKGEDFTIKVTPSKDGYKAEVVQVDERHPDGERTCENCAHRNDPAVLSPCPYCDPDNTSNWKWEAER